MTAAVAVVAAGAAAAGAAEAASKRLELRAPTRTVGRIEEGERKRDNNDKIRRRKKEKGRKKE